MYENNIESVKVTVVGGGRFCKEVLGEMHERESNILVTGITGLSERNEKLHEYRVQNSNLPELTIQSEEILVRVN